MNQFFKFLFASCLGTLLALVALIFIGGSLIGSLASSATQKTQTTVQPNSVLWLELQDMIPEKTNNVEMDPIADIDKKVLGITDMVKAINTAKEDPDIKGIYLNTTMVQAGSATTKTLRDALVDFRTSGKFVISYAHYYTQNAYYLASAADSVLLNPVGMVDFRGLSTTLAFFKNMLDKLDVDMRIFYAGKFKSATEPFRYDKMSPENRLQVREYLDDMYDVVVRDIATGRGLDEARVRQLANDFTGRNAAEAVKSHLVDRLTHEDGAFSSIKAKIGLEGNEKLARVPLADYFDTRVKKADIRIEDKIAVVYAEGSINDGDDKTPGIIYDGPYVKMLRKIRDDNKVKAVVLRINSPGGSVLASENIYREVMLCKQAGKKIVVSMGDLAASGGYYIACPADSIFASPNTITGSIGVFFVFPMMDKTMRNKFGVTFDTVETGRYSAFGSPFTGLSNEEGQMLQTEVEETYQDFITKVAQGRGKTPEQIHEIAQGRVWTGTKAKAIGLVDDIGGLDRAISAAAKLAGLGKYRVTEYPATKSSIDQLIERFMDSKNKNDNNVLANHVMRSELAEFYPLYKTLREVRQMKGMQARLPYVMEVR
jgi:protease IV